MDIFLVNFDRNHAESLCKKLAGSKDGSITLLNAGEMKLYLSDGFQHVRFGSDQGQMFTKLIPGESYVAVVDPSKVDIGDIEAMAAKLDVNIAIVREKAGEVK